IIGLENARSRGAIAGADLDDKLPATQHLRHALEIVIDTSKVLTERSHAERTTAAASSVHGLARCGLAAFLYEELVNRQGVEWNCRDLRRIRERTVLGHRGGGHVDPRRFGAHSQRVLRQDLEYARSDGDLGPRSHCTTVDGLAILS